MPFWGKPPLSFWAQALAIKVFGLSEFSLRLPSWLTTLAMVWLVWRLAKQLWNVQAALWSSLVFATMALTYISAGAVMTDSFLALGTTLTLVSFCLVMSGEDGPWRWLFFIGLVIGLLSKARWQSYWSVFQSFCGCSFSNTRPPACENFRGGGGFTDGVSGWPLVSAG